MASLQAEFPSGQTAIHPPNPTAILFGIKFFIFSRIFSPRSLPPVLHRARIRPVVFDTEQHERTRTT